MAKIIGGFAVSHTPTIAFAHDANKYDDPVWAPIFEGFRPVKQWLAEQKPDVIFYVYNDHMTSFFTHYSHFALGVGEEYAPADEGGGQRDLPPIKGDPDLAQHIARVMVANEFDLAYWQGMGLDHGAFSPLSVLLDYDASGWPVRLVPLQCGVLQHPIPSAKRFWDFGRSLRRAIQSYPKDIKVAIAGTGGLSHQVHGEGCGFNNPEWDAKFMELLANDPKALIDKTVVDLAKLGGWEGAEVVMWLLMRGALSTEVKQLHQSYFLPSMTAIATMLFEDLGDDAPPAESDEALRARAAQELAGAEELAGTYPFTIERAVKGFRINHFLHRLIEPDFRKRFVEDQEGLFAESDLTDEEKELIRSRNWIGMIHYGVIFFMLEKMAAVLGIGNIDVYAAFRGMTVPEFQKTRNAAITYSVAGKK